jgi:hypothetical protein
MAYRVLALTIAAAVSLASATLAKEHCPVGQVWLLFRLPVAEHGNIHKNSENNTIFEANRFRFHREIRRRDRDGL